MYRVFVIEERDAIADVLIPRLRESPAVQFCHRMRLRGTGFGSLQVRAGLDDQSIDTVVYSPSRHPPFGMTPDVAEAETILRQCAKANLQRFLLLSDAQVYGVSSHNQGLIPESRVPLCLKRSELAREWRTLESVVTNYLGNSRTDLTILRPVPVLTAGGSDYFSRLM